MSQTFKIPGQVNTAGGITFTVETPHLPIASPQPTPGSQTKPGIYTARLFAIREVRDLIQHLTGRVKTLIDATVADPEQRKAVKDLIHGIMWKEHYEAALEWAEKTYGGEDLVGLKVTHWEDVKADRIAHHATPGPLVYPFPFGN